MDVKNPDVLNWLLVQADDANAAVAAEGIQWLGLLGEHGKPTAEYLRKAATGRDPLRRVRAALSLWQVTGKADDALPVLIAALAEKSPQPGVAAPAGRFF